MSFVFGAAGIILTVLALACVGGLEVLRETASEHSTRQVASRLTRRQLFLALVVLTVLLLAQLVARIAHFT